MSITVNFCNCSDSKNTASKTFAVVSSRPVTVVYPCDVLHPTFKVVGGHISANSVTGAFGRNYWIVKQTLDNGVNYVECVVDALSSWSSSVYGSNQFVVRSATGYDLTIPDNILPCAVQPVPYVERGSQFGSSTESFIIGVTEYDFKPSFVKLIENEPAPSTDEEHPY